MQFSQNLQSPTPPTISYIPARLTEGKEWYVSYYVIYPPTGQMRRKLIKINRIKSATLRRKMAREIIKRINGTLAEGRAPFVENVALREIGEKYKNKKLSFIVFQNI